MKKVNGVLTFVNDEDIKLLRINPKEFWKGVTSIGDHAFAGCKTLTDIKIPNSVTSIGASAFTGRKTLKAIKIPNSVTSIGTSVFFSCENLTDIKIPNSVTSIGDHAFAGCKTLTDIKIPNSVTSIGYGAFAGCKTLTDIKIPNSVTSIGRGVFYNCINLKSVTIPESVTSIGTSAFADCIALTDVKIPNSVTSIGTSAFEDCIALTDVKIPNSVTSIGQYAFYNVPKIIIKDKSYNGDFITIELFDKIKSNQSINLKYLNKIFQIVKKKDMGIDNINEFVNLCANLGMLEPYSTKIQNGKLKNGKPNLVPVCDIAYTFMQGLINSGDINLNELHMNLQEMKLYDYNEAFMKFVINKTNWSDIKENLTALPRVYDWFKTRTNLDLNQTNNNALFPTTEENRFKILVYETAENGIDRMHWCVPTMKYLLKEFAEIKFTGILTSRDKELSEELSKYNIYTQKHFNKAKEIDEERINLGVKNILSKPVKQSRISSLDKYRKKTNALSEQVLQDGAEILRNQIEDTSLIFTYEMLSKSDPANFAMGCMTSCCATLYGAGAGAMRGMIIHPDMQPMVIRDFDNNIVSFGIIYVNRDKGYAVVNDFEVNMRYEDYNVRKAIYEKAMEGINAFVEEYNQENPEKTIKKVTCGISPNWEAINEFIKTNPKSEILKAPNFNDFKYAGSGFWNGDWHRKQYEIYNKEENTLEN